MNAVWIFIVLWQKSEPSGASVPAREDRQYAGVAVKVIPCNLAAGEESHKRYLT
jgi:hypothetical protein